MSKLELKWKDVAGMKRMENALARLDGDQKEHVLRRAVNHTGDKARTVVVRTLAKQTGLSYGVIRKAVKSKRANYGSLEYTLRSSGGDISLKYFKARETRQGVIASPLGRPQLFAGRFIKAGHFPKRVTAKRLNGHVFDPQSTSSKWGRLPIVLENSGVFIPAEMVKGETLAAFNAVVERELPDRVMHEIGFLVPGFFS